ncbi:MAG: pilus assembly protein [Myxococcales bacterium]|nr:MAG: pilus assembly protein [Myxococcales bacterium]
MRVRPRTQHGAVTAETAVVLPILAAFALGLVWVISLGVSQARAVDAAREVARVVARGDSLAEARSWGSRVAPDGARITVDRGEERVTVRVAATVRGPGGLFDFLPGFPVRAEAVAATERGEAGP